jgi:GTP diphosphokinase / guanosine-3',5'-bis(diphosphate) 3'-diphosphatase
MDFTKEDYDLINKEFEELRLVSLKRCASQEEYEGVIKAFEFANEAHKGVRRRSGVPYIIHPIAVAKIVVQEIGLGYKSIVTALLHDIVEDTDYTVEDIRRLFGDKIASLVDGLTKIKAAFDSDNGTLQAENFKRILLTLNEDVRVILIKLADRLHNVRTIDFMPDYKKDKILSETMYIFIPLAHRLGLYSMKSEMENIWLKNREPEAYKEIQNKLDELILERSDAMDKFIEPISNALKNSGYIYRIVKRTKTPYSIWHKMETKGIPFEQIFDLYAVRIIFEPKRSEEERTQCWHIYALVSGIYTSKTDRIRDWVTKPKSNGYEALHCTVMSPIGNWVEIQIRSERMNAIAEKGVAAHWMYKKQDASGTTSNDNEMDHWLDMVRDVLNNPDVNALEFLDRFHDSLLDSEIYVFTPKGESKSLPKGSTALDLAYSIHSEIGNKAIAAKINLKLAPLSTVLRNGDQVEIITAESQKPKREWLDFLKTGKARSIVYDAIRDEIQATLVKGREILEKELAKYGVKLQNRVIKKLLEAFKMNNKDELYNKIAVGLINLDDLENILKKNKQSKNVIYWTLQLFKNKKEDGEDEEDEEKSDNELSTEGSSSKLKINKNRDYILSENPLEHTLSYITADCCYPIPGDNVVGFMEDDGSVIIHKKTCPHAIDLASKYGDRIVNAKWSKHTVLSSLARIRILGVDRIGILNEVTKYITLVLNINIRKVLIETHDGIFEGFIDCYVHSIEDLDLLIKHLKVIKGIESVTRVDIKEN